MKRHSKKKISTLLVLLLTALNYCFGLNVLNADDKKTFPDCQIAEIGNLEIFSDKIFQIVALKMQLEIDKNVPKPIILTDRQITPHKFSSYLGFRVKELIPYYFFKKNTLVVPLNCRLDSLAHELVHYFQVMYRNENLDFDCGPYIDNLEVEALVIQRWFKSVYLTPHKANYGIAVKASRQVVISPKHLKPKSH